MSAHLAAADESISFALIQVCRAHRAFVETQLQQMGLHAGQEMFLMCINDNEGMTQTEIADHIGISPPTVSKMLSRMEASGMVMRQPDTDDSRVTRVHLTEKSRALRGQIDQVWADVEARTTAGLSLEERLLLRRLLMQMHGSLTASP